MHDVTLPDGEHLLLTPQPDGMLTVDAMPMHIESMQPILDWLLDGREPDE